MKIKEFPFKKKRQALKKKKVIIFEKNNWREK